MFARYGDSAAKWRLEMRMEVSENIVDLLDRYCHPKFGIKRMTMYRIPVSSWLSDMRFFEWCYLQGGENNLFCSTEELFEWARDNQEVVNEYVDARGYPHTNKFDLYGFLDEARSWHIQIQLLDEYESFVRYATLKYLESLGVKAVEEYSLEKLLKAIYRERTTVCLKDIKRYVEYAIQDGEI